MLSYMSIYFRQEFEVHPVYIKLPQGGKEDKFLSVPKLESSSGQNTAKASRIFVIETGALSSIGEAVINLFFLTPVLLPIIR